MKEHSSDDLPFYFGDDSMSGSNDLGVSDADAPAPWQSRSNRNAYAARYRHLSDDRYAHIFESLHVNGQQFQEEFHQYCRENYRYEDAIDTINPYNGVLIDNQQAYFEYLREHFYYTKCCAELEKEIVAMQLAKDQLHQGQINIEKVSKLESMVSSLRSQLDRTVSEEKTKLAAEREKVLDLQGSVAKLERQIKKVTREKEKALESAANSLALAPIEAQKEISLLNENLTAANDEIAVLEQRISLLEEEKKVQAESYESSLSYSREDNVYLRRLFKRFALFALILCIACSWFFHSKGVNSGYTDGSEAGYKAGFEAGEDEGWDNGYSEGHETGSADGYDRGYDFGYNQGYGSGKEAARSTYSAGTGSGTGSTRDTAIATGYIGNLNTGKFHKSTCGYLPNQENQTVFSSREAAINAGYVPCGRCHP